MKIEISDVGHGRQPIVTIDRFTDRVPALLDCAARMRPFPESRNYYPGLRRLITGEDVEASRYVDFALRRVAPVLERTFGARRFRCLEASFSMVTTAPHDLDPRQRAPHVDSLDPDYVAVLHYLTECAGTAFYRQRSTGIEVLTPGNQQDYRAALDAEGARDGYIAGSDDAYEQIGEVAGIADRVAIYRGALLHSGIIRDDPATAAGAFPGRLTANLFVHLQ